ncbi:alpha-L-fucosidase [Joostella sp.]|uniref:alpha-L-fucosidase n=1 Tax=Joostella sp. TaxID=2231138 RepID=UPI003A936E1B
MKNITLLFSLFIYTNLVIGQAVYEDERYVPETDPLVLEKLEQWQGLKFGLLMHWGAYSQWGVVESWSLCPEEYGWCARKKGSNPDDYFAYKKEYEALGKSFNPIKFNPEKWASAAKDAGMKYVVFTTKHHDGYNMFDTQYSDYKITNTETPFSKQDNADVTKAIFNAFRDNGMWAGAYFSKPDWHMDSYWDPYFPPKDRNVNYDPEAYPEKWKKYVDFTHNQILELMTNYGDIDILWLDGGWVAKKPTQDIVDWYGRSVKESATGYMKTRNINQDIEMDKLVEKAREKQPGLIVVDRAVHGKNQNYLTPENRIPEKALPYPWESCIIAGGGWSYSFNAKYMSGRKAVHTLADIVSKGGNLLLNIAPSPEGEWDKGAYKLLSEIGDWMGVNSEAIYETNAVAPYKFDNVCITEKKDGTTYLIYLMEEGAEVSSEINVPFSLDKSTAHVLGKDETLEIKVNKDNTSTIKISKSLRSELKNEIAWVIKI